MTPAELEFWARMLRCRERSDTRLRHFRAQMLANIQSVVGRDYSETTQADVRHRPLNMAYQMYSTLVPHVVARNPQSDISTYYMQYQVFAYQLEQASAWLFDEIDLEDTLGKMFGSALAGWGVVKVGREAGLSKPFTRGSMSLRPYVAPVSNDNFVFDPDCLDIREAAFIGDVYEVNRDYALDTWTEYADRLDADERDHTSDASRLTRKESKDETLYKKLRVIDLWLAPGNPIAGDAGVIVTVPASGEMYPLETIDSDAEGPYEFLGLADVPDNPLPLAPLTAMAALDEFINAGARKLVRENERAKSVLVVERAASADGKRIIESSDGQAIAVDNIDRIKEIHFGGADPKEFAFTQFLIQMHSRQAGNQDMLAGVATGAQTATEAGLLGANADYRILDLKKRLYKVVKRITRKLGGMLLDDSGIDVTLGVNNPFLDPVKFTPEYRRTMGGNTGQYTFDIQPYSMEPEDPKKRIENIMLLTNQVILPTLAAAQASGKVFDVAEFVDIIGNELHVKELARLYHDAPAPVAMGMAASDGASAPALPSQGGPRISINAGTAQRGGGQVRMPQGNKPAMAGMVK